MIVLRENLYPLVYRLYNENTAFFPLIAAVILREQEGIVYCDHLEEPKRFYIEHKFGFSQVFGLENEEFDLDLKKYLLIDKDFKVQKVRLYTPIHPRFLMGSEHENIRSERQRFVLKHISSDQYSDIQLKNGMTLNIKVLSKPEVELVDNEFKISKRFWRDKNDFVNNSLAAVGWIDGEPVSICYAAAIARGLAEIDVLTSHEYRKLGIGKRVVQAFIQYCLSKNIQPVWDCFTNNAGSMALSFSVGFVRENDPYKFYTINK